MLILNYQQFGGKYSETSALRNVLAHQGIVNPHSGQPFSEAMLLGIGGGVGAAYFVFEFGDTPSLYIGTRYHSSSGEFLAAIYQRLGLKATIKQTAGGKAAAQHLHDALAEGRPAILALDRASLPYQAFPASMVKYMEHTAVVYGLADGLAYIGDKAVSPLTITADELAAARAAITAQKHRLTTFDPDSKLNDLASAVEAGIRAGVQGMLKPSIANFGLTALSKWADMILNPKDKKGWAKVFPRGPFLYDALRWVFHYIETYDTPGSGFRAMYADFLDEANATLSRPHWQPVAAQYRELAAMWHTIAEDALPDAVPAFRETKQLLRQRNQLFAEQGAAALPQMQETQVRLAAIRDKVAADFPLSQTEVHDLLSALQGQVLHIL